MICLRCRALRDVPEGAACPACGVETTPVTKESVNALVEARTEAKILEELAEWKRDGLVDRPTAERIWFRVKQGRKKRPDRPKREAPAPAPEVPPSEPSAPAVAVVAAAAAIPDEPPPLPWQRGEAVAPAPTPVAHRHAPAIGDVHTSDTHHAVGTGDAMFGDSGNVGRISGGLDALSALDQPKTPSQWETEVWPVLYENIGWFIGGLLVLGGSVYGVLEAWRSLDGGARHVVVAGALFLYHAGFIGLGALLARKSQGAGRVLGSIGAALLPMVFAAVGALARISPAGAAGMAVLLAVLSIPTLSSVARRFELPDTSSLPTALIPSLLAMVPLAAVSAGSPLRLLLAFTGLAAFSYVTREAVGVPRRAVASFAVYGMLATLFMAIAGAPDGSDGVSPFAFGTVTAATFVLFAAVFASRVRSLFGREDVAKAFETSAAGARVLTLAVGAWVGLAAGVTVFGNTDATPDATTLVVLAAAAGVAAWSSWRNTSLAVTSAHFVVPLAALAGAAIARAGLPLDPAWWAAALAVAPAIFLVVVPDGDHGTIAFRWGVAGSIVGICLAFALESPGPGGVFVATAVAAALVTVCAYLGAGVQKPAVHYLSAGAATVVAYAWFWGPTATSDAWLVPFVTAIAAGAVGLFVDSQRRSAGQELDHASLRAWDDVSLALLGVAAVTVIATRGTGTDRTTQDAVILAAVAAGLLMRSLRDQSRLVSTSGAFLLLVAIANTQRTPTAAANARLWGLLAVGAMVVSTLRRRDGTPSEARSRLVFGTIPSGPAETGSVIVTDGFAFAAMLAIIPTVSLAFSWMDQAVEADRMLAVEACVLLAIATSIGFFTHAAGALQGKGNVATLALAPVFVAMGAILYRYNRQLQAFDVAWRYALVGSLMWAGAQGLVKWGAPLAERLERKRHGELYHLVPHVGVALLGVVLGQKLLGTFALDPIRALVIEPPLLPAAIGLLALLLGRSSGFRFFVDLALAAFVTSGIIAAAQLGLHGPTLLALEPSGARWVIAGTEAAALAGDWLSPDLWLPGMGTALDVTARALTGAAGGAVALGSVLVALGRVEFFDGFAARTLLASDRESNRVQVRQALATWTFVASSLVVVASIWRVDPRAAAMCTLAGGLSVAGRSRRAGLTTLALGGATLLHALANQGQVVAAWSGAWFGTAAVAMTGGWFIYRRRKPELADRALPRYQGIAVLLGAGGLVYALAEGGAVDPTMVAWQVLNDAGNGLAGALLVGHPLAAWAALAGVAALVGAWQRGTITDHDTAGSTAFAGFSLLTLACVAEAFRQLAVHPAVALSSAPSVGGVFTIGSGMLAAALVPALVVAHLTTRSRSEVFAGCVKGATLFRDVAIVAVGALAARHVSNPDASTIASLSGPAGVALVVAMLVSVDAFRREKKGLHVYFVQTGVVGLYAVVRAHFGPDLPPEADAVFALVLGFILVGVTVVARRAGVEAVSRATRRFAALLPIGIGIVMPTVPTFSAAAVAAGTAALWSTLGWIERNRIFGTLGAAAGHLAMLVMALASGFDGVEIYLGALGLFVMTVAQIMASTLGPQGRLQLRVIGSLLVYSPTAVQIAFQVGRARDGTFPVLFGLACLAGVAAGMVMHIRAYLAMGVGFLVLDVVANLVHASLRNHRVGFAVLSLAGLLILGGMVLVTLRRQEFERVLTRIRSGLAGWE